MKKLILGLLLVGFVWLNADVPPLLSTTKLGDASYQLMMVENLTGSLNNGLEATLREFMDGKGQSSGLYIGKAASQTDNIALQFYQSYKLSFCDNGLIIYSSADGQLDIDADVELELGVGLFDVNASNDITIDCSDNTKSIALGTATSGLAVTIGNATSETTVADNLTVTGNTAVGGTLNITGPTTTASLFTVGTVNIDATTLDIDATDDIDIDTSDTVGGIAIGTVTSGVPISIGHTTSETTVNDNLTITGTTTLNATTLSGTLTGGASVISGTGFDINAGTIDATTIGASSATTGAFTTLSTTGKHTASGSIALNTSELILDTDGHESITSDTNGQIDFKIGGTDELLLDATQLYPYTNAGLNLGVQDSREFRSIYLDGDVDCEDDLVVGDDASIGGDATIDGATTIGGALSVRAMSTIQAFNYAVSGTIASDAYTATLAPAITAYTAGMMIMLKVAVDNTTACTLALNGLDPITILTVSGVAPASLDLLTTGISILVYNGTNFILINPATTCD